MTDLPNEKPTEDKSKVGAASSIIPDKELREAIATFCARRLPNKFIREHPSEYWNMIGDLEALFQARQRQLLTELLKEENQVTYALAIEDGKPLKAVPVKVLEQKLNEML